MSQREAAMASAYKSFCRELSTHLYDEDPAGIGSSIGAPADEYDSLATRLAVSLRNATAEAEIRSCIEELLGSSSERLVDLVAKSIEAFHNQLKKISD
jgi:hypothetical protein